LSKKAKDSLAIFRAWVAGPSKAGKSPKRDNCAKMLKWQLAKCVIGALVSWSMLCMGSVPLEKVGITLRGYMRIAQCDLTRI
jgi:hypothetical protein